MAEEDRPQNENISKAKSLKNRSDARLSVGNYKEALDLLLEAMNLFEIEHQDIEIALTSNKIGKIFKSMARYEDALKYIDKSLQILNGKNTSIIYAEALFDYGSIYKILGQYDLSNSYFEKAREIYEKNPDPYYMANVLVEIGSVQSEYKKYGDAIKTTLESLSYFEKLTQKHFSLPALLNLATYYRETGQLKKALLYNQKSIELVRETPNPLDKALPYQNIGLTYLKMNKKDEAEINLEKAIELFAIHSNPNLINSALEFLPENRRYEVAIKSTLGCIWLLEKNKSLNSNQKSNLLWLATLFATENIMKTNSKYLHDQTYEKSEFVSNWRIKNYLENTIRAPLTSETLLNFLIGINDLSNFYTKNFDVLTKYKSIDPLWFIELPLFVLHGENHLYIRLNNIVRRNNELIGYPNSSLMNFKPMERIKISIQTHWLQNFEIDQLFYPKTQEEQENWKIDKTKTWIANLITMDLGDYTKKENTIDLNFSIQLFFDMNQIKPDIITTTNRLSIPIIRQKNIQLIEKFRLNHNNSLAVLLALISIVTSIYSTFSTNNIGINIIETIGLVQVFLGLVMIVGFVVIITAWLMKERNSEKIHKKLFDEVLK